MRFATALALVALGFVAALGSAAPPTLAGSNCATDASIDSEEEELLRLINEHRQQNGVPQLALSSALDRSAAWKSQDMAAHSYFAHDDEPIGRTWSERVRDCGYTFNTSLAENIAAGNATAAATFEQWRDSPGHNANMLSSDLTAIGIGRAYSAASPYGWYWTTDFGGVTDGDVSCDGTLDAIDAALILQRDAGLIGSIPCQDAGDVNFDGTVDAIDSALILQYDARLIDRLPP